MASSQTQVDPEIQNISKETRENDIKTAIKLRDAYLWIGMILLVLSSIGNVSSIIVTSIAIYYSNITINIYIIVCNATSLALNAIIPIIDKNNKQWTDTANKLLVSAGATPISDIPVGRV